MKASKEWGAVCIHPGTLLQDWIVLFLCSVQLLTFESALCLQTCHLNLTAVSFRKGYVLCFTDCYEAWLTNSLGGSWSVWKITYSWHSWWVSQLGKASLLNVLFVNREELVGDVMVGGHLGHSDHEMIVFDSRGSKKRGQQSCWFGFLKGGLWPV